MAKRPRDACLTSIRKIDRIAFLSQVFFYNTTAESFDIKEHYRRRLSMNKSVLCANTVK